jgi:hypothetical protein
MKKRSPMSPQPITEHYPDDETDIPPELAELPFLPNTDPAILRMAVRKALGKHTNRNESQPDGAAPRP